MFLDLLQRQGCREVDLLVTRGAIRGGDRKEVLRDQCIMLGQHRAAVRLERVLDEAQELGDTRVDSVVARARAAAAVRDGADEDNLARVLGAPEERPARVARA